jgi:glycosyltransferase involved in cell wall biosynthesis
MFLALKQHCSEVTALGPGAEGWWFAARAVGRFARICLGKNIDTSHTVALSRVLGRTFRRKLSHGDFDLVFAPAGSTETAFLETRLPIVLFGDLTASLFRNYAANLTKLSPWSVAQLEQVEGRALHRASHLVYASEWAAMSAMQDYQLSPEKISVIPLGANLDEVPGPEEILARRPPQENECKLLFIGVDWERKGGSTALEAMRQLRRRGVNATLTVVGCVPPGGMNEADVHVIPFLDKSRLEHQQQLVRLLMESDIMLFPTRREAFGIVCCEANACGTPLIVSDTGGVPVRDGQNGVLLPPTATGSDYADAVQSLLANPDRYLRLSRGGRQAFESRLNWDAWGQSMTAVFRRVLTEKEKITELGRVQVRT